MARALSRFTIEPDAEGYLLSIEDDDGNTTDFTASVEQLDLIAEAIDEHLSTADDLDDYDDDEASDEE